MILKNANFSCLVCLYYFYINNHLNLCCKKNLFLNPDWDLFSVFNGFCWIRIQPNFDSDLDPEKWYGTDSTDPDPQHWWLSCLNMDPEPNFIFMDLDSYQTVRKNVFLLHKWAATFIAHPGPFDRYPKPEPMSNLINILRE